MSTITANELFEFLTYLAEFEIIPRSHVSIHAVNFTLNEIRHAIAEMQEQGEIYQPYLQHKNESGAHESAR